jgi:hypothetical protein
MRAVKIEWLDAHGDGGAWMDIDDIDPSDAKVVTYGVVVNEDDTSVCVVQSHGFDGQYYNHMCVPRGMILRIIPIE